MCSSFRSKEFVSEQCLDWIKFQITVPRWTWDTDCINFFGDRSAFQRQCDKSEGALWCQKC